MRDSIAVALFVAVVTALTYIVFPGHTYLQQDTQIYVPMLEKLSDPSLFGRELLTSRPHLGWTLYDEVAVFLHRATTLDFEAILTIEQLIFRALGVWGVYLIVSSMGFTRRLGMFVSALFSLGAFILGPQVITLEYEPTPRAFAVPMVLCATGLALHRRWMAASVAGTVGLLYHAPTTGPFWLIFAAMLWRARVWMPALTTAGGLALLVVFSRLQPGLVERQPLVSTISPTLEQLQRMRAAYNWVSLWPKDVLLHYVLLSALLGLALYRIRARLRADHFIAFVGLASIGLLSIPISYLTLEGLHWSLIPQFQPARAVLFLTAVAIIVCSAAGIEAARLKRYQETFAWMLIPLILPVHKLLTPPYMVKEVFVIIVLAGAATGAIAIHNASSRRAAAALAMVALLAYFGIPLVGDIHNYPMLWDGQLRDLVTWARSHSEQDAVFLFPRAGKALQPGLFRAEAKRAVYVDWKGGGQVNYFEDLAIEWWNRWQATMLRNAPPAELADRGINYLIVDWKNARSDLPTVYQNPGYLVYRVR